MQKRAREGESQGLRERSKAERQARILSAARMLFTEVGYEAATLNQIAAIAGLGKGTIFGYVTDKRDLIFLIFQEDMSALVESALAELGKKLGFFEKMVSIAQLHFELFAKNPRLARMLLNANELSFRGIHLEKYLQLRGRLIKGIEKLVLSAQQDGVISRSESAGFIARQVFFCFSTEVREWLMSPHPEWRTGLRQFKRSFKLLLNGVGTDLRHSQ